MKVPFAFSKQSFLYLIPAILIIIIGIFLLIQKPWQKDEGQVKGEEIKLVEYTNDEFKVRFNYPETFRPTGITDDDKKTQLIFRAEQTEPAALFSLRYEEKLGMLKVLQKGTILEILADNFNSQYPKRFPDFRKEKEEAITVDGIEAKQFYFTYLGTDQQTRMKQRFVIVTRDYQAKELGSVAFYFSFQSKESDFETLNSDFFKILQSFKFI